MKEMLTVSMAVYNTDQELVTRAVKSVLNQTYKPLRLVVINDGGDKIKLPRSNRIFHLELEENRGLYFCHAITLLSLDNGWFAVHDSDDWSEKTMYKKLIAAAEPYGVAYCDFTYTDVGKEAKYRAVKESVAGYSSPGAWTASVKTVQKMWEVGGINPKYRVGFDTFHNSLIHRAGEYGIVHEPLYHYERRPASLTVAPETAIGSEYRELTRRRLIKLRKRAKMDLKRGADMQKTVYMSSTDEIREEAEAYAERLRGMY